MDMARGIDGPFDSGRGNDQDAGVGDRPIQLGGDERRMHVRAYNHWVSLLRGRAYPSIEDLDPENIADFGPNSVLLDFSNGIEDPAIRYIGRSLREECGVDGTINRISDVPSRSLLSRLTDHYLQIIANRAPIGFEAEFVGTRGHNTMYRGILMPFSSDEDTIDFIYGVINWKEMVDAETQAKLNAEIEQVRRSPPRLPLASAPVWADGPSSGLGMPDEDEPLAQRGLTPLAPAAEPATLGDRLLRARESAAAARASDTRSRAALYRALSRAYDFARAAENDPNGYGRIIEEAGLTAQARAPMTPAVKLVFGIEYDKTRLTEFAAVLAHARRNDVAPADFDGFLETAEGGIKGIVRAERALRRPAPGPDLFARARAELMERTPLAHVKLIAGTNDFVILLARPGGDGLDIVATLDDDRALTERAVRKAAA
ncbi:MAG: PAS domain-containing protein [Pseudomonadota bacterium]